MFRARGAYASALLQLYPYRANALSDDLESFVWSLVLPVARFVLNERSCVRYEAEGAYFDPEQSNCTLLDFLIRVFHLKFLVEKDICGGEFEIEQVVHRYGLKLRPFNLSGPLAKLLRGLYSILHEFYVSPGEAELWAQGGIHEFAYSQLSWKGIDQQPGVQSDCLDTHKRTRDLFTEILDDPSSEWTDEKTADQFAGAF